MRTLTLMLVALVGCQSAADEAAVADASATEASADLTTVEVDQAVRAEPVSLDAPVQGGPAEAAQAPPSRPAALHGRHLRRSADLRVSVRSFDETVREARALAARYGGLVTGEDGSADGEHAETLLTLRVPSDRFEAAVDALAALGGVERRSVSVDDVTAQVVDLEARLRAKRAAEARLAGLVAEARGFDEMLTLQGRLEGLRAEIESMEAGARALRGSVALSTIRATLVTAGAAAPPPPGVLVRAADAVVLGWNAVLAVALGLLPLWPLAVLGALGLAAWRRLQPPIAV